MNQDGIFITEKFQKYQEIYYVHGDKLFDRNMKQVGVLKRTTKEPKPESNEG